MNYKDESGEWQPIDVSLEPDGAGGLQTTGGPVEYSFEDGIEGATRDTTPVELTGEGWTIEFGLEGARQTAPVDASKEATSTDSPAPTSSTEVNAVETSSAEAPEPAEPASTSTVEYPDVEGQTDLEYSASPHGLKEVITLAEPPASASEATFTFPVQTDLKLIDEGSHIRFVDEGGADVATAPDGFMTDAARSPAEHPVNVRLAANGREIEVVADYAWLTDPGRVYPVAVDPQINVAFVADTYVDSGTPTTNYGANGRIRFGSSSTKPYSRGLIKYDINGIPSTPMLSATWKGDFTASAVTWPTQFLLRPAAAGWNETQVNWNTAPGVVANVASAVGYGGPTGWASVDVTDIVADWRSSAYLNFGFRIDTPNPGQYWKEIASRNASNELAHHYLEVTMAPTSPVTGVVLDGRPLDEPGGESIVIPNDLAPVAGAQVQITLPNPYGVGDQVLTTTSNAEGAFSFPDVPTADPGLLVDMNVTKPSGSGFGAFDLFDATLLPRDGLTFDVRLDDTPTVQTIVDVDIPQPPEPPLEFPDPTCRQYFSNDLRPNTIRVFHSAGDRSDNKARGQVRTYDYEYYARMVLQKEWGVTAPEYANYEGPALLEAYKAGAVAITNFAWFRINYRTRMTGSDADPGHVGACYDVTNHPDVDQAFDAGLTHQITNGAVSAMWRWLVRNTADSNPADPYDANLKSGREREIFEGQYQRSLEEAEQETDSVPPPTCGQGATTGIEADNGRIMSQLGTKRCALDGRGWQYIVNKYYFDHSPVFDLVPPVGAMQVGDFDNDGVRDLAVGVPGEDVPAGTTPGRRDAGAINVIYGGSSGLTATGDQLLYPGTGTIGSSAYHAGGFGTALATGNFNGDAYADLAVGSPGYTGASPTFVDGAGAVVVLYGSADGLSTSNAGFFSQSGSVTGTPEFGDGFGSALAVGDFNGGADDLAIGVPGEDTGAGTSEDPTRWDAGAVQVLHGSSSGLTATGQKFYTQGSGGLAGGDEEGDLFGSALVAGAFDGDAESDLAIGVPGEWVGSVPEAGLVHVIFDGDASDQLLTQDSSVHTDSVAEPGDLYGSALAVGNILNDTTSDLVVGVPAEDVGTTEDEGVVHTLITDAESPVFDAAWLQTQENNSTASGEAHDRFGSAVRAANLGGGVSSDLAIGIPGEDVGSITDAGAVVVLYTESEPGLAPFDIWTQDSYGLTGAPEVGDEFGSALAAGSLGHAWQSDLVIATPKESGAATSVEKCLCQYGVASVIYGGDDGLTTTNSQTWSQADSAILGTAEQGDLFG